MSVLLVAAVIAFVCFQAVQAQQPLQLTMDANNVWVRAGKSPVLQYRYGDVPFKPYLKELYTPGGLNVLLDAPPDHLHHHGLMFAVAAAGVNFWEETPTAGRQAHRLFSSTQVATGRDEPNGLPACAFISLLDWTGPSGIMVSEVRHILVCQRTTPGVDTPATTLAWESDLSVPRGKQEVVLSGSHYFGLGMRFPHSMDGTGEFLNAGGKEGTIFRGEERLVRSNWCAYRATADGKPVTVAMFGHPENPRGQTTWFTMAKPFAYMSATLGLHDEPLKFSWGRHVGFEYCVTVWDASLLPTQIDAFYQEWARQRRPRVNVMSVPSINEMSEVK
jgi:hypothetical protein